jgi:amidase
VHRTAEVLREAGHDVREIPIPFEIGEEVSGALRIWLTYAVGMSVMTMIPPQRHENLTELTRYLVSEAEKLTAADILSAQSTLARYASTALAAFDGFDVALTPATAQPPVPRGHFLADGVESTLERMLEWSAPTPWANLTGQPAVAVPAGFTAENLPLGVQLIGRPRTDAALLSLAGQIEQAQGWGRIHPIAWDE